MASPHAQAGLLGAEIRVEYPFGRTGGNARPLIGDGQRDPRCVRATGTGVGTLVRGSYRDADQDRAALGLSIHRVEYEIKQQLAKLFVIGLNDNRPVGHVAVQADALLLAARGDQLDGLLHNLAEIAAAFFQFGRAGEIEKRLDRTLQSSDLCCEDGQVAAGQPAGIARLGRAGDEHLHRRERIAKFVGQAGSKLSQSRHLLVAEHRSLVLLQPIDHRSHMVGHAARKMASRLSMPAAGAMSTGPTTSSNRPLAARIGK